MFMLPAPLPRFDRIVSLIFVVLIGLAVIFLVDRNPDTLRIVLGGDLPTITLSWFLIGSLVVMTCAGADVLARSHPEMQTRSIPTLKLGPISLELAPGFWVLPSFSVVGPFAFFRLFSGSLGGFAFALALVAAGGSLLATLVAQHYALDRRADVSRPAQLVTQALVYLITFGLFSAVFYARYRTLYSAALIGVIGALLAYALLQWSRRPSLLLAALVGLSMAEATWALNYWATTFLLAGALLLVLFYVSVSLLQHLMAGPLNRRLLAEYALLGGGLVVAVVYATLRL
jgi:hypothetical protein